MSLDPTTSLLDVAGRTAIVTGASSGLGEMFAEVLAAAGANVVLAARRVERLESLADRLQAAGAEALVAPCDVADADQVADMVARAAERFGCLDILVNNAGTAGDAGPMPE